jgi:hypothetical protein
VDFPDDATFLNPLEKHVVLLRLRTDGQASARAEAFQWKYVRAALSDWKTYMGMLTNMGIVGPVNAFALFLPSIIAELGYSSTHAQLLTVPPYAAATISVFTLSNAINSRPLRWVMLQIESVFAGFSTLFLVLSRVEDLQF